MTSFSGSGWVLVFSLARGVVDGVWTLGNVLNIVVCLADMCTMRMCQMFLGLSGFCAMHLKYCAYNQSTIGAKQHSDAFFRLNAFENMQQVGLR